MKLAIVTQKPICQEEYYANMTSIHQCYIVDIPDEIFPKEVIDAYKEMYKNDGLPPLREISNIVACSPKT